MKSVLMAMVTGGLVMAVAVVVWQLWQVPGEPGEVLPATGVPENLSQSSVGVVSGDGFARSARKGRAAGDLPASLRGTEVDGAARVDAHGELIIDADLRLGFDYFLAAIGEEDLDTISARVAAWLDEELPKQAAREAWAVFRRYLGYREELRDMPDHDGTPEGMRQSLRARRDRRNAWLGQEVAEAFFGFEDAYDEYMLERMALQQNDSLTEQQRRNRLDALQAEWPEELRQAMKDTRTAARVSQQVSQLREQGADEHEIRALRKEHFGSEAVERLDELDHEREEWDRRYRDYRQELEQLQTRGLDKNTLEREIRRLREERFDERERRRVEALDRMEE